MLFVFDMRSLRWFVGYLVVLPFIVLLLPFIIEIRAQFLFLTIAVPNFSTRIPSVSVLTLILSSVTLGFTIVITSLILFVVFSSQPALPRIRGTLLITVLVVATNLGFAIVLFWVVILIT